MKKTLIWKLLRTETLKVTANLVPVKVDVKVLVENHKLKKVELLRHECGLAHPLDVIVDKMVEQRDRSG